MLLYDCTISSFMGHIFGQHTRRAEPGGEVQVNGQDNESSIIPDRSATDYGTKVLSFKMNPDDVAVITDGKMTDEKEKAVLAKELVSCNELIGAWSDSPKVVEDCKELLKSASDEVSKAKGNLILAYNTLWEVRQRLVQAWCSRQSRCQVIRLSMWLLFVFAICVSLLVLLRLLPGWTPRVAATNTDVAVPPPPIKPVANQKTSERTRFANDRGLS